MGGSITRVLEWKDRGSSGRTESYQLECMELNLTQWKNAIGLLTRMWMNGRSPLQEDRNFLISFGRTTQEVISNPGGSNRYHDENFLLQVIEEPVKITIMLNLVPTNKEGPVRNMELTDSLGSQEHKMVVLKIPRAVVHRKLTTLDLRTADFGLQRLLLGGILWYKALQKVETQLVQESCCQTQE